jgi:hypothetical protein
MNEAWSNGVETIDDDGRRALIPCKIDVGSDALDGVINVIYILDIQQRLQQGIGNRYRYQYVGTAPT